MKKKTKVFIAIIAVILVAVIALTVVLLSPKKNIDYSMLDKKVVDLPEYTDNDLADANEVVLGEVKGNKLTYNRDTMAFNITNSAKATVFTSGVNLSHFTLSGDAVALESINSIKLANVALANLMSNNEVLTLPIPIPEGCSNVSGETEATVDLRLPGKSIKSLRTTNIQILNAPAGMTPVSKTTVLWVSVRANTSQMDAILEENIRVVADLSGIPLPENGSSVTVPATIYVDSVEGAGVVGSYSVVVELSESSAANAE